MEVDSIHSLIERRIKKLDIYHPEELVEETKNARKNPTHLDAQLLTHDFFLNYNQDLIYKNIRPGSKSGDPKVTSHQN